MGNWKAIFPILLALVIAVSGSYLAYQWIQKKTAPKETFRIEAEAVPVVVAAVDIPWGTKLSPEMVKTVSYLKESLPNGYTSDLSQLKDRVIISPLKAGDPVVAHRLAPVDIKTGGVAAVLTAGKRAVAVKGDKVIGISGLINPGNRVDVLVTMEDPEQKLEKTKIVLENILVLATGTQIQQNDKGEPAPVDVYALEVTPEESEKLALASAEGKLQFALRNQLDAENILTRGTTISQTLASLMTTAPPKPAAAPAPVVQAGKKPQRSAWTPRRTLTVEVIRGLERTKNSSLQR